MAKIKMQIANNKKISKLLVSSIIILFLILFLSIMIITKSNDDIELNTKMASIKSYNSSSIKYSGLKLEVSQDSQLNVGDKVKVKISTDGYPVCAIEAVVHYDKYIFEEITPNDISFVYNWTTDENNIEQDVDGTFISMSHNQGQIFNTGDLVEITFTVKRASNSQNISLEVLDMVAEIDGVAKPCTQDEIPVCEVGLATYNCIIMYNKNTTDEVTQMPSSQTVEKGNSYTIAQGPSREGYAFRGWNSQADGYGSDYAVGGTYTANSDFTLYAKWEKSKSKLTVNPNNGIWEGSISLSIVTGDPGTTRTIDNPTPPDGNKIVYDATPGTVSNTVQIQTTTFTGWTGTPNLSDTTYTFCDVDETITANYVENPVTLLTATRPGYDLVGWYDSEGNNVGVGGSSYNPTYTTPNQRIGLEARWEGKEYTVTFDYDGGTGDVESITVKNSEQYGDLPTAEKEGYTFIGWYDTVNNKVKSTDIVDITDDITLKAKYEINSYFVTFKNDDDEIIKTIKCLYGLNATFTGEEPTKDAEPGYQATFVGWDDEEKLINITSDIEVKAVYEVTPIVYTITYYNLKESDNSQNAVEYTIEDEIIELVDLQNKGKYIFLGWYKSNDLDAERVTSIDTSELENIILYARWENDSLYYTSQKYEIEEDDNNKYLNKITPDTTVKELIENSDTNGVIVVIDQNGKVLEENDKVGTKMIIKVTRYDEQINLIAVVMGDLDGDGSVTATDLSALNQTILRKTTLIGAVFKAADLDDNKKLTATDLSTENQILLKLIFVKKQ